MKKIVHVTINGTAPLLMAAFKSEDLTTAGRKQKATLTSAEMAEQSAYRDENGKLYVPKVCLWACFIEAGRFVVYKGKQKISTRDSSLLALGLKILDEKIYLNKDDYDIGERAVVNPTTGGRTLIYQPEFKDWKLNFTLEIDITEFPLELIKELIAKAGKVCGLLAYRPNRKGFYGTFEIEKFEVQ